MEEGEQILCLGTRCFVKPYEDYVLPPFYPLNTRTKLAGRDYRWRLDLALLRAPLGRLKKEAFVSELKVQRGWALPDCLGLRADGRWRWQALPLSFLAGARLQLRVPFCKPLWGSGEGVVALSPTARLQIQAPVLGPLALQGSIKLLPRPQLKVKHEFRVGTTRLKLRAVFEVAANDGFHGRLAHWGFRLNWHPADSLRVERVPGAGAALQYERTLRLSRDCSMLVAAHADIREQPTSRGMLTRHVRLQALRLRQLVSTRGARHPTKRTSTYLRAASHIGACGRVSVVPGHWIDHAMEPGAPGEREFNQEVADVVEQQLRDSGWEVLRPDRDAPHLRWEEYLNWVSQQTLQGIPVLEVHGQGSAADYRGFVLGVIGEKEAPLNKELARYFGTFPMDWRELAVPRRGGVIVESFNSDEVLQMAPWHRKWAAGRLAKQISDCINRAAAPNRRAGGCAPPDNGLDDSESFSQIVHRDSMQFPTTFQDIARKCRNMRRNLPWTK